MKMESMSKSSTASSSTNNSSRSNRGNPNAKYLDTAHFENIMVEFEQNNKEMAVDVPDSFIARTKTPPKYPPPPALRLNGTLENTPPPTLNSRDHLRIEKDGHLLNTMEGPKVPSRGGSYVKPTEQQSLRMKKYSEDIVRKSMERDRRERHDEFLRQSIRNSQKLNALKENGNPRDNITGFVNSAFTDHDEEPHQPAPDHSVLLQATMRLQKQGDPHLSDASEAFKKIIMNPDFVRAVKINQKIQDLRSPSLVGPPVTTSAQDLTEDILNGLEYLETSENEPESSIARELVSILCREDFESMLCAHDKMAKQKLEPRTSPVPVDEEALLARLSRYTERNIKVVRIEKTHEPLGATVKNEGDAVIVGRIIRGGTAETTGLLNEGDEILEVNDVPMRGKNVNEVCDILAEMKGTLTLLVVPARHQMNNVSFENANVWVTSQPVMHVKAHIDYDPEDDHYLPCRELGICFMKGNILHVINQKDPNWWQAKREGEEESQLPGLIPSASFQQQREAIKHSIAQDVNRMSQDHRKSGFLCAKRSQRKKGRRRAPLDEVDGDGNPSDEIIIYEEVALYYPRSDRKRPVVLIGPPNIGRHELRQRLMLDNERFAAAVPHTSRPKRPDEIDGQDYHFITRLQFEQDILARKFVEHGEYEKAYYGTSLEAIRSVVLAEKICVLNLHPQSLKILKNSDLMPYVVFVAPPSMEKLKRWKLERSSEPVDDDELKDIIERAREMEELYGHYFDMVIIYSDPERAYQELLREINLLEREPQWVPANWVARNNAFS